MALALVLAIPWRRSAPPELRADREPAEPSDPTWVDLLAHHEEPAPPLGEDRVSVDLEGRVGRSAAPLIAITNPSRVPAADEGQGAGRVLPPAFRRDTSTLRARISDGAKTYHPAHERSARTASSPQSVREEPRPGPGDSARTRGQGQRVAVPDEERGQGDFVQASPRRAPGDEEVRSQGPLDTETGPRRYDLWQRGPARDNTWSRSASDEPHPSLMDLSAAAVPGPSQQGHGPGAAPGAVARPSAGAAPSRGGVPASVLGPSSDSAGDSAQDHYYFDLDRRVTAVVHFPKELALDLRQGDAIVTFTVAPDGRLTGPIHVVKSAGFAAFDEEAVAAVQRAAPFPSPGRARPISLRVWFRNPMVR